MADSQETLAQIIMRLLHDAAFFERFLQDPDAVLSEFPDLDPFDGDYLKEKITDWASLTAVAERFDMPVPERPSDPAASDAEDEVDEPALQLVLHLRDDAAFFALFRKDPAAALSAYPNLEEEDAQYIQERVTDAASLQAVIERFQTTVQGVDLPPEETKGIDLSDLPQERYVNTGFATQTAPEAEITNFNTPLAADQPHYFWLEIGELLTSGLAQEAIALPTDKLPPEAKLKIALFSFADEIALTGAEVGELQLAPQGQVRVTRRADEPAGLSDETLNKRLFFAVQTMAEEAYGRLRCNIYYQNTLVQSHLIIARTATNPSQQPYRMMWHISDYTLSKSLNGHQLEAMGETTLSIMVNDNGHGSHGFRFVGEQDYKNDATLGEGAVKNLQEWARAALRQAAWGDTEEYSAKKKYLYSGTPSQQKFKDDLLEMAQNGHRAFDALFDPLVGDDQKSWDVLDWMVKPGQVQVATKENAQLVVPAAMFYDYPYLDGSVPKEYSLCSEFEKALDGDEPLENCVCFQGNCPTYHEEKVVCPSGFWGFRHSLGLPMSVQSAPDAPLSIGGSTPPKMAVSVWKDFGQRPSHEQRLQQMGVGWEYADSRDESLDLLKRTESQVVYFFCHGGLTDDGLPYLHLGDKNDDWFTRGNLRARRIRWQKIRPLVFINGCHTTQLTPERALDFVTAFITTSRAAGVIGTEITIFESIATQFAEECLRRFLFAGEELGKAVRGARLHMLKNGNPLGLVYILYALPALKLA